MTRIATSPPLFRFASAALLLVLASCQAMPGSAGWRSQLRDDLPLYGHRNFIVVADAAYPLQVNPGIRTVVATEDHLEVVDAVLAAVDGSAHVRPIVWLDAELDHVAEADGPGVEAYRGALGERIDGLDVRSAPHGEIIELLDETASLYTVLLIKTDQVIPYSSVFVELQCGYWDGAAEEALRASMAR